MNTNVNLIVCTDERDSQASNEVRFFSGYGRNIFWFTDADSVDAAFLEKLVFSVARKPQKLLTHLQRIYYCYVKGMAAQLYAAIIDFLIILNGRGLAISWRVVLGAKTSLSEDQFHVLSDFLNSKGDPSLLPGNEYSIFSRGLQGINRFIRQIDQPPQFDYDPLALARDHIEYSQLDEAKRVLEKAVLVEPARMELQHELMDLYQLTNDVAGFNKMLGRLAEAEINLGEWIHLDNYFKGRESNG